MNEVISQTFSLIDTLEDSNLIKELTYYQNEIMKDLVLLEKIKQYQLATDNNELLKLKKELYENKFYEAYNSKYSELSFLILKINHRFEKLLNHKGCHNEGN